MTLRTRAADTEGPSVLPEPRAIPTGWLRAGERVSYFLRHTDELECLAEPGPAGKRDAAVDVESHHLVVAREPRREPVVVGRLRTPEMRSRLPGDAERHFRRSSLPEALVEHSVELSSVRSDPALEDGASSVLFLRGVARYLVWNERTLVHGVLRLPAEDARGAVALRDALLERADFVHEGSSVRPRKRLVGFSRGRSERPAVVPDAALRWLSVGVRLHPDVGYDAVSRTLLVLADFDLDRADRATKLVYVERGGWTRPRETRIGLA